ncbi:MAG TPA: DUF3048 domain-containing protein [Acidimicrobiales bacterium]|nr:DUF3048 domain-containing protein [Acidimicrobiales bacterium]
MLLKEKAIRARARGTMATVAALAAAAAVLASCGGHSKPKSVPTTSTTLPAPTTTAAPPPTAPLTGLPQPDSAQLNAPAVVLKIDNIDDARPQTGLADADIVYEEQVEGGLTRLAAVYQSSYPKVAGPVRSGRLTDEGIADDLNHPVYAMSGTNPMFLPILRSQPFTEVDDGNRPDLFYRAGPKPAPHNLYTNVESLAKAAKNPAPPAPLFQYREPNTPLTGAGVAPATHLTLGFSHTSIGWTFNAQSGAWQRTQNGTPHVDNTGAQLSATNVVVLFINYIISGVATGEGGPPAPIPEGIMTGTGQVWFLSGGQVVKGTWSRSGLTTPATYADSAGAPILLAPGKTWVELVPTGTVPSLS